MNPMALHVDVDLGFQSRIHGRPLVRIDQLQSLLVGKVHGFLPPGCTPLLIGEGLEDTVDEKLGAEMLQSVWVFGEATPPCITLLGRYGFVDSMPRM